MEARIDRDDAALVRALGRDPEAFVVLYRRYERLVLAYHRRRVRDAETAADLTAETFASALASLRKGAKPAEFAPWLFAIARNKWADFERRRRVDERARLKVQLGQWHLDDEERDAIDELVQGDEIKRLFASLPDDQREALELRFYKDLDYGEMASELSCSQTAARKRVSRGLALMRGRMEER